MQALRIAAQCEEQLAARVARRDVPGYFLSHDVVQRLFRCRWEEASDMGLVIAQREGDLRREPLQLESGAGPAL